MEIVALVQPGPATYFPGPDGKPAGFDVDLLQLFAAHKNLPVRFVVANDPTDMLAEIAAGNAHIGAGGLYRPASKQPEFDAGIVASANANALPGNVAAGVRHQWPARSRIETLWTTGHYAVEPTLIYNGDGFKPSKWTDLRGQTVAYVDGTHLEPELAALRNAYPEVQWNAMKVPSVDALISQVSDGTVDYAVVASNEAAVVRNAYLGYETAFTLGARYKLAWAVGPQYETLRDELDEFLAQLQKNGTLRRLADRHFARVRQIPRIDAGIFQERVRKVLPQYRTLLQEAQEATGIDRIPRTQSFADCRDTRSGELHFCRIIEIDVRRRLGVHEDTTSFARSERRRGQSRQRRDAEEVIDHLQIEGRRSRLFRREQRHAIWRGEVGVLEEEQAQRRVHRCDGFLDARSFVPDDNHGFVAAAGARMLERVHDERNTGDGHQRLRNVASCGGQSRATARRKDDCLGDTRHVLHCSHLNTCQRRYIRATFDFRPKTGAIRADAPSAHMANSTADRYERDTIDILKRLSRRPIEPAPDKELMADLGFDSLQILELVGELEDHFNIAVPLNSLTHIRTVGQIVAEVRTLASAESGTPS